MRADEQLGAANFAVQAVHFPMNSSTKRLAGSRIISSGDPTCSILPAHHHDAVGHFHRLFLIVGDEHAGEFQLFVQLTQPAAQLFAHLRIQRAERFVQQQNLRFHRRARANATRCFWPPDS